MKQQQPDAIGRQIDQHPPANALEPGIGALGGQRLEHRVPNQSGIDDTPDRKDIPGRYEQDRIFVGHLAGLLAIKGNNIRECIAGNGCQHACDDHALPYFAFMHSFLHTPYKIVVAWRQPQQRGRAPSRRSSVHKQAGPRAICWHDAHARVSFRPR